jgi:hypothetical protein
VLGLALLAALLAGCDKIGAALSPPVIDVETPGWGAAEAPKQLAAEVRLQGDLQEVTSVFVRYARHTWPGVSGAHHVEAVREPGSDRYVATLPAPGGYRPNQVLHYQWFAEHMLSDGGEDVATASSPLLEHRLDFPDDCDDRLLAAQESIIDRFDIDNPHEHPLLVQPHYLRSFEGAGVTWARADGGALWGAAHDLAAVGTGVFEAELQLDEPALLLYAPAPGATLAQLRETHTLNDPYTLVGWAHGTAFDPAQQPTMECVPFEEWFIHEAGWHPFDGGFVRTPPAGDIDTGVPVPPLVPVGPLGFWHPRLWDLHMWLGDDGPPSISILHPGAADGFPPGDAFPDGTFFLPTRDP